MPMLRIHPISRSIRHATVMLAGYILPMQITLEAGHTAWTPDESAVYRAALRAVDEH